MEFAISSIGTLHYQLTHSSELDHVTEGPKRGTAHIGWAGFEATDPGYMNYAPLELCALGEMRPGESFPMHAHAGSDHLMVIRSGKLRHRDSLGTEHVVRGGDVVNLSSGTGCTHAEEVVGDEPVSVLLFCIKAQKVLPPFWERATLATNQGLQVIATCARTLDSAKAVRLSANATLYRAVLQRGEETRHQIQRDRQAYIVAPRGELAIASLRLASDDRLRASGEGELCVQALQSSEVYLLDLPERP